MTVVGPALKREGGVEVFVAGVVVELIKHSEFLNDSKALAFAFFIGVESLVLIKKSNVGSESLDRI